MAGASIVGKNTRRPRLDTEQPGLLQRELILPYRVNVPSGNDDADLPCLQFGMVGFDHSQRHQIEGIVNALPLQAAVWRVGPMPTADAWLICGEKTRALPAPPQAAQASLRVLAGLPSERAVTLSLDQINRPLAFSLPVNSQDMEPRFTFDAASPRSLQAVLGKFERCLWSLRAKFTLGKQLIDRETELKPAVYHVMNDGKLLAVMNFMSWKIGMLPDTDPQQFETAAWEKRPIEASAIPSNFFITNVTQLRWIYAQHSARNVLPGRYRHETIYLRQAPQVAISWLTDSHLLLVRELSKRPATLTGLAERTGLPYEQLTRDLTCLYFAASLTTTPSKAVKANARRTQKPLQKRWGSPSHIFNSTLQDDDSVQQGEGTTVAAQLRAE